jgi:peptide/nickel transport system permease protein
MSSGLLTFAPPDGAIREVPPLGDGSRVRRALAAVLGDRRLAVPTLVLVAIVLFAIIAPLAWGVGPDTQNLLASLKAPSLAHPMGTDQLGRDIFARVAEGARISLLDGTLIAVIGAVIGGVIGLLAGTTAGASDAVLMRVMDAILAFPPLILAMAVTVGLGVGLKTAAIGATLVLIPWYARLVRSEAIRIRSLPFIEAAHAIGASRRRIIARHVVPHVMPTLAIQIAAGFAYAVLLLAGLSFLGLGAQIPTPEWGAMITDGLTYSLTGQWWVSVFPGVALLVTVTAASMLSDRLRDVLDPRSSGLRS